MADPESAAVLSAAVVIVVAADPEVLYTADVLPIAPEHAGIVSLPVV